MTLNQKLFIQHQNFLHKKRGISFRKYKRTKKKRRVSTKFKHYFLVVNTRPFFSIFLIRYRKIKINKKTVQFVI